MKVIVGETPKFMGGNSKILVKCRGNVVKIVGENGGNEECAVGEIAIIAWQHCLDRTSQRSLENKL